MTTLTNGVTQAILVEDPPAIVSSTGVSATVLVTDPSATVSSAGVSSSTLIITEQAFTKEATFFSGVGQQIIVADGSADVSISAVNHSVLIVTQGAIGADASYLNQVYHTALLREAAGKTSLTSAIHQALIVTEGPPGLGNVDLNSLLQTILIAEPGSPTLATQVSQRTLVVTDPAPPLDSAFIGGVNASTLILEPPAPVRVPKVLESALLLSEGPILTGTATGVTHVVITQDLYHGELYANAASQSTLVITEAKSRDPDRLKVLTNSYSYVKPYNHPSTFAEKHRLRGLTRGIATATKFKIPTQVAAMQSVKILTTSSAVKQEFMDPKDLAAKIQVRTLERAVVSKTLYPEHVISDARTLFASKLVAQKTVHDAPQDIQSDSRALQISNAVATASEFTDLATIRSMTQTQTLRGEVAYSVTATDPSGIRTVKQALQANIASASAVDFADVALIQSDTRVQTLGVITAHALEYEKDIQSTTIVGNNCMQVVLPLEYTIPTDPMFKSQIHLNRLKNETVLATAKEDPAEIKSNARTRAVKLEHCTMSTFVDPTTVKSTATVTGLMHSVAQPSERPNPAGITPSIYNYQLSFSSAYGVDRYVLLPTSMLTVNQITVESALSVEMYDPSLINVANRVYMVEILTALESPYPDPNATKPNRRVSSARVTRK